MLSSKNVAAKSKNFKLCWQFQQYIPVHALLLFFLPDSSDRMAGQPLGNVFILSVYTISNFGAEKIIQQSNKQEGFV